MFDMDSGASLHNAEQRRIKLRYNGYFEKVQKPLMRRTATGASANKMNASDQRISLIITENWEHYQIR